MSEWKAKQIIDNEWRRVIEQGYRAEETCLETRMPIRSADPKSFHISSDPKSFHILSRTPRDYWATAE
ncbi:hypothetical protein BXT89_17420 [Halopseudomonas pachastrellae]|uniref:Uncharacterized protein n=1 Tax=Halopseudomonas pachastrellae TaxID=254161 RepID=A0A1S8DCI9_9GAMM|nr:hypothetical protein BXT89_17420 [Halopseudomonas pachastrellae]